MKILTIFPGKIVRIFAFFTGNIVNIWNIACMAF